MARHGVNQKGGQLYRLAGTVPYPLVLNTARPLFKDNVALRKAVNLALDRAEIAGAGDPSNHITDQILTPAIEGWVDHDLYPLRGPDLGRARELARGRTRGGKAALYAFGVPRLIDRARIIARNLEEIGLDVTVKAFSARGARREDVDAGREVRHAAQALPVGLSRSGQPDGPASRRPALAAANRLQGPARMPAFSALEADIMREEAPWAPMWQGSRWVLVSKHVGCVETHPIYRLDLAGICSR